METILDLIKNNYKELIKKKYQNDKFSDGNYIIHLSVIYNNLNLLKDLNYEYGNKIFLLKNNFGETIFHLSCKMKLYKFIYYILDNFIKITDIQDNIGNIGFHYFINQPNDLLNLLNKYDKDIKKNKIDLNKISNKYNSFIINFIEKSKKNNLYYELIKKFIYLGINLNLPHNMPPIIAAVKENKIYIVELLLNTNKIEINKPDFTNGTSIFYAVKNNNIEILSLLIKNKANLNYYSDFNSFQFLNYVLNTKNDIIINFILDHNIDCNILDKNLNLPINIAIYNKLDFNIIKKIILKTNNLNYQNIDGNTPLFYILKYYDWKTITNILENKELDIFVKNNKNEKLINLINEKNKFYELVVKSYLNYAKNNKNVKSKIIKDCYNEKNLTKNCIKKIRYLIEKNKKSTFTNNEKINFINNKISYINNFNPHLFYSYLFYINLLKKYDNLSIPQLNKLKNFKELKNLNNNNIINRINYLITLYNDFAYKLKYMEIIYFDKKLFWYSGELKKAILLNYKKKRFMLISLVLILNNTNHQNFIIYDNKKNTFERFDPHGYINNEHSEKLDKFLKNFFVKIIKKSIYISPKVYMNRIGFQNTSENESEFNELKLGDPGGFCLAWCFWYLEMKLINPDVNNISLINKSFKLIINSKKSFTEYIRDYANNLVQYIIDSFDRVKIDKKLIYNKLISKNIMNKVYKEIIIKDLDKLFN